jgi:hypothetical protein
MIQSQNLKNQIINSTENNQFSTNSSFNPKNFYSNNNNNSSNSEEYENQIII